MCLCKRFFFEADCEIVDSLLSGAEDEEADEVQKQ
jgi:hypothetical protein